MAIDVEEYRERLIAERDRLAEAIGSSIADMPQPISDDRQIDAGDAHLVGEVLDVEATVADMKSNRLDQINAALQSIEEGSYGICIKCGKPIDPKRLDAEPTASAHVDCLPADQKEFKPPSL